QSFFAILYLSHVTFLSSFAPPPACAVEEIFLGYTQPCLRVVRWWSVDIHLVVWGLYSALSQDGTSFRDGDIAVTTGRRSKVCFARSCLWSKSVDGHVYIAYRLSLDYSDLDQRIIKSGMENMERGTCVRFASHELMHALGFVHEHSRIDRDNYVTVLWENIWKDRVRNFEKFKTNSLGVPYDYDSIMHFGMYSYSEDGDPTIKPKRKNHNTHLGQRTGLSQLDKMKINKLYKCDTLDD
uniref:Metalloendopeptidase n=1 Tax=Oncorhynchus tshawytscha TaxID=74940 RepID=A0AAZ3RNH6_ONCTS